MRKDTVLIVDDEPININAVATILSRDYELKVATSAKVALELIRKKQPDLILLDINMPEMDGYEMANILQSDKETSKIPFIFLTANSEANSIKKGFEHGAVDYIAKPFSREELQARVQTHLKINKLKTSLSETVSQLESKVDEFNKSQKEFETIFNNSYNGIAITDLNSKFLMVNDSYTRITGYSKEELLSLSCTDLTVEEEKEQAKTTLASVIKKGHIESVQKTCISKEGKVTVNTSISLMPDKKRLLFNTVDMSKLKKAEEKIHHYLEVINQNVLSSSTDLEGVITDVSEAFCNYSGYERAELIGKKHSILKHPDMDATVYDDLWATISNDKIWSGNVKNRKKDGSYYWANVKIFPDFDENNQKIAYTAIRQDITDRKKIEEISIHDELTGLYNRRHFNKIFSLELNRSTRDKKNLYFLMIDVDNFKLYNDNYGHQEGDSVLVKIGKVLNSCSKRADDFAFRLGGEEFGILYSAVSDVEAIKFANRVKDQIKALKIVHAYNDSIGFVSVSAGLICKGPSIHSSVEELYKLADKLLYDAKEDGRNNLKYACLKE